MKINMKEVDGKVVVTLDGEMDTTAAVEVEKVLSPLYSEQDKDIILDWSGGGGTKDVENNAFTTNQYATNYWDIHDLSTDVYDKLEMVFAQAVNYDNSTAFDAHLSNTVPWVGSTPSGSSHL